MKTLGYTYVLSTTIIRSLFILLVETKVNFFPFNVKNIYDLEAKLAA